MNLFSTKIFLIIFVAIIATTGIYAAHASRESLCMSICK